METSWRLLLWVCFLLPLPTSWWMNGKCFLYFSFVLPHYVLVSTAIHEGFFRIVVVEKVFYGCEFSSGIMFTISGESSPFRVCLQWKDTRKFGENFFHSHFNQPLINWFHSIENNEVEAEMNIFRCDNSINNGNFLEFYHIFNRNTQLRLFLWVFIA